ncbi:MAG: hypothetical protein JRE23_14740 [Deltaproteobacteria bacterium]|nr:hypothetical protein [Deltaproteobacteria bacterium]
MSRIKKILHEVYMRGDLSFLEYGAIVAAAEYHVMDVDGKKIERVDLGDGVFADTILHGLINE